MHSGVAAVVVDSLALGVLYIGYARAVNEGTPILTDFLIVTLSIAVLSKVIMAIMPYVYHKKNKLAFSVLPEFRENAIVGVDISFRVSRVF